MPIEKTKINRSKKWEKAFLLFKIKRKTILKSH